MATHPIEQMSGRSRETTCLVIAARQFGVIQRAQALAVGMTASGIVRQVKSGRWERFLPGIYRIEGSHASWKQRLMAASLWAGEVSAVSHRAAAGLWRLDGFKGGPVEIIVTRRVRAPAPWIKVHYGPSLRPSDLTAISGIPVTRACRTLFDLAGLVEAEVLETALDEALRRRLLAVADVRADLLRPGAVRRQGVGVIREWLELRKGGSAPTESRMEVRLFRLLREAGLPLPVTQFKVVSNGAFVARVDFAYPEHKFAIETDGYAFHSTPASFRRDRERRNNLSALDWRVLNVTWDDLWRRPGAIVAAIRTALGL